MVAVSARAASASHHVAICVEEGARIGLPPVLAALATGAVGPGPESFMAHERDRNFRGTRNSPRRRGPRGLGMGLGKTLHALVGAPVDVAGLGLTWLRLGRSLLPTGPLDADVAVPSGIGPLVGGPDPLWTALSGAIASRSAGGLRARTNPSSIII